MKKRQVRKYRSGAFRDANAHKLNYLGSLSPLVLRRFAEYMREHNLKVGKLKRDEGNWKKGMSTQDYMGSELRHRVDTWLTFEGYEDYDIEELLCAELFNIQGHLHNILVEKLKKKRKKKRKQMR